jgi:hypothetical protein
MASEERAVLVGQRIHDHTERQGDHQEVDAAGAHRDEPEEERDNRGQDYAARRTPKINVKPIATTKYRAASVKPFSVTVTNCGQVIQH